MYGGEHAGCLALASEQITQSPGESTTRLVRVSPVWPVIVDYVTCYTRSEALLRAQNGGRVLV